MLVFAAVRPLRPTWSNLLFLFSCALLLDRSGAVPVLAHERSGQPDVAYQFQWQGGDYAYGGNNLHQLQSGQTDLATYMWQVSLYDHSNLHHPSMFSPMHLQHIQDTSMVDSTGWDDQTQQASSPRKDIVMYNFFPTKSEEHSSSMSLEASPQGENNRVQVKPPRRYTDAEVHDMFDERWKVKLPEVKEERITKYRSDSLEDFNERQHKAYNRHRNKVKSDLAEEIGFTVSAVDHITRNQSPGGPNHTHRVYLDKELERKRLQEEFDKGNIVEIPQILPKRNYPLNAQAKREAKKNKRRMGSQEAGSSVAQEHGNLHVEPGAAAYEEHAIPYMNQGNAGYVQGYQVYRTDVPQQHFNPGQQGGGVTAWMGQGNGGNEYVYGYPVYPTPSQGDHSNNGYGHYQGFPRPWQG